jgi:hypothetical protein
LAVHGLAQSVFHYGHTGSQSAVFPAMFYGIGFQRQIFSDPVLQPKQFSSNQFFNKLHQSHIQDFYIAYAKPAKTKINKRRGF